MLANRREIEIEWGDCDAAGIVFYPRYFAMFDASTAYLFEKATGLKKQAWREKYGVIGFPMVDTAAKFLLPSRYGDVIAIETRATVLRRSSFDIEHRVYREGALAIEARETRVWAAAEPDRPGGIKGVPLPEDLRRALQGDPGP